MNNILKIFSCDLHAMRQNVVSVILTVGLVVMPSMFVWYNVLACWDVFGNTGNLKVAVANTDVGYKSELLPMEVNVGDQVVNALRANDQLDWVFTTEEDAIDGAAGGRYYAALVIPNSFSQEMMNFYSNDSERAPILYYSNEKKSAIAPKVTDQGADQISYQINKVFAKTISEVGLNLISSAIGLVDDEETSQNLNSIADKIDQTSVQMKQHAYTLTSYLDIVAATQDLLKSSQELLGETKNSVQDVEQSFDGTSESATSLVNSLDTTAESLAQAITLSISNYEDTAKAIDDAFSSAGETSADTSSSLRNRAESLKTSAKSYQELIDSLNGLLDVVPSTYKPVIEQFIAVLQVSVDMQNSNAEMLEDVADSVSSSSDNLQQKHSEVREEMNAAIESLRQVETAYSNDLKPKLKEITKNISQICESLDENYERLSSVGGELSEAITNADSKLEIARCSINEAVDMLNEASEKLSDISNRLNDALDSGNLEKVKEILGDNPSLLAESLSAPIAIDRIAEFPVGSFGAAMSPLYASLGLWVGCLLSVVLIKTNPSEKTLRQCKSKPHLFQIFIGRFGVFAIVSIMQSSVIALGNLFFLDISVTDPFLYVLCFWITGLVFQFIMYTLVASFGNVGKAIGVLLLIIQVTGAGGSFPLQLLPDYATILNPFLPATYAINAMRAAMNGLYFGDYWVHLAKLLAFVLPMAVLGLLLRGPFVKTNEKFVEMVEKSKLI